MRTEMRIKMPSGADSSMPLPYILCRLHYDFSSMEPLPFRCPSGVSAPAAEILLARIKARINDRVPLTPDPACERPLPVPNRLSSLPHELQLKITQHLNSRDVFNVSAASRTLREGFPDPHVCLNDELSMAWFKTQRVFGNEYYLAHNYPALTKLNNLRLFQLNVLNHAVQCEFPTFIVRWLVYPAEHKFSCSKCRVVKLGAEFGKSALYETYPFKSSYALMRDPEASRSKYREILDALECGDCLANSEIGTQYRYHHLGFKNYESYIIKCNRCLLVKRADSSLPKNVISARVCEDCFKEVRLDWFLNNLSERRA